MRTLVCVMAVWLAACDEGRSLDTASVDPVDDDSVGDDSGDNIAEAIDLDQDGFDESVDCDDSNPEVNPDAIEVCNAVDDDCDGEVDVDATDAVRYAPDQDEDGFGDATRSVLACAAPEGHVTDAQDCDDDDPAIHPDASERCDPDDVDEDCDGLTDDADDSVDPEGFSTFYPDEDEDGVGSQDGAIQACDPPERHVSVPGDCDDNNPEKWELCIDGDWTSTNLNIRVYIVAFGVTGTCNGSMAFTVDTAEAPEIQGTMECTSGGDRSTGSVTGTLGEGSDVSGTVVIDGAPVPWSGTVTDTEIQGSFSGSGRLDGYNVNYSGGFKATPQSIE